MEFVEKTARTLVDDLLVGKMGNIEGKKILDVGSGNGDFLFKLKGLGGLVKGLEVNETIVTEAKKKYPDLDFEQLDLSTQEFRHQEIFDFVVLEFVSAFVSDFGKMLDNINQVMSKESLLMISLLHPFFILSEASDSIGFPNDDYFVENVLKVKDNAVEEAYFSRPVSWYVNLFAEKKLKINFMVEEKISDGVLENVDEYSKIKGIPQIIVFGLSKLQ